MGLKKFFVVVLLCVHGSLPDRLFGGIGMARELNARSLGGNDCGDIMVRQNIRKRLCLQTVSSWMSDS